MSPPEGYTLVQASPFEVGLLFKGQGVRTWWVGDFGCRMPDLDDFRVVEAIECHQRYLREYEKTT